MSTPQTRIYICNNVGLTNEYKHTIFFSDQTEQTAFFTSKVSKVYTDYTYARKNWNLKVESSFEDASSWSYLFFINPDGRPYYYFINDIKYISDETVELALEMDVMQTYMFDYNLSPCFVEREHSTTDEIGDNTVEENVELGQLKNAFCADVDELVDMSVLIMSTVDLELSSCDDVKGGVFDGVFSGCNVYAVDIADAKALVERLEGMGEKIDGIVSMWMYPTNLFESENTEVGVEEVTFTKIKKVTTARATGVNHIANRPNDLDGYTPKNNKLLTYPYNYLYVSNNAGNSAIYRYERFLTNVYNFTIAGSIFPDGSAMVAPINYNGTGVNYDEGFTLRTFPTCAWNADAYKIWLAQNQSQHALTEGMGTASALAGVGMAIAGVATANPALVMAGAGSAVGGFSSVASLMAQKSDMERMPPQARGGVSSTLLSAIGKMNFTFYSKTITAERARMIDDFFTVYGYATKCVKVPNRNARKSFTYTKTVGCHISGNICTADKGKIESIYDNGITFWNKNETVGNYLASNGVM